MTCCASSASLTNEGGLDAGEAIKRLGWLGMARSGRAVPEYADPNILEVIVSPYRVIYTVLPKRIDVLTVMHERQLLPGDVDNLP